MVPDPEKVTLRAWRQQVSRPPASSNVTFRASELAPTINTTTTIAASDTNTETSAAKEALAKRIRKDLLLDAQLQKEETQLDAQWWIRKSSSHKLDNDKEFEFFIDDFKAISTQLVCIQSKELKVWLNLGWLIEMHELNKPLRIVHPTLDQLKDPDEIVDQAINLISSFGASVVISDPILLKDYIVIVVKKYSAEHEWIQSVGNDKNTIRMGITDYAQKALGDLVFVELPKVGVQLRQKELVGVVESVKGASDIYAPVSGVVTKINDLVISKPSTINKSPEKDGWLCEIELSNDKELGEMYDQAKYEAFCKGEE